MLLIILLQENKCTDASVRNHTIYNIMRIMWFSFFLYDKSQAFDFAAVLKTGGHNIDSGGVDGTVT